MIREEVFKPLAGPMGALGISSETGADFGKERRTTTKAPPGEMLIAVANSSNSLPLSSRLRTKTGMARCNRAHLRSSFLDKLRRTCLPPLRGINIGKPHLMGQTRRRAEPAWNHSKTGYYHGDYRSNAASPEFHSDRGSGQKGATFFPSGTCFGLFPIDSLVHLT